MTQKVRLGAVPNGAVSYRPVLRSELPDGETVLFQGAASRDEGLAYECWHCASALAVNIPKGYVETMAGQLVLLAGSYYMSGPVVLRQGVQLIMYSFVMECGNCRSLNEFARA
jgi:hypothetical protein